MSFAWPWLFLVLPLPWLLRRLLPSAEGGVALRVPVLPAATSPGMAARPGPGLWMAALAWLLLVAAAARPQLPVEEVSPLASGRDLMLAFDVSASMGTWDLQLGGRPVDRLTGARQVAAEFLRRREGDRVGLVVFGRQAYVHTPLTFDLEAVANALSSLEVGLAGRETAIGDAIALAVKRLQGRPGEERVLVLITDGTQTAGNLEPRRAAWLARREGIPIHVVGIGTPGNEGGLDEETLKSLAEQTGGSYHRAADSASLVRFWQRLEEIEPVAQGNARLAHYLELYPWPLGAALVLAIGLAWVRAREEGA